MLRKIKLYYETSHSFDIVDLLICFVIFLNEVFFLENRKQLLLSVIFDNEGQMKDTH